MDFPQILATETKTIPGISEQVIPAIPTKLFDRWWISRLRVLAPDANAAVSVQAVMTRGCKLQDGSWELSTNSEDQKTFVIEDVFAKAATDADLANVLGGLLVVIGKIGTEMGVL
jgi:hypothetical protein